MSSPNPPAPTADNLPADLAATHALILALQGELATARQQAGERAIEIERLRLALAKARRELYGQSSEWGRLLVEQLELQLEELEETSAENEVAGELSTPAPTLAVTPRKPARRPLPEALPRERIVHPGPCVCDRCGGDALRKIGEDVLESLECEPRRWKVVQHVREKFACRSCETVSQTPAPSHPIRRGRTGPNLLAIVLAGKYAQHLPLHRQSAAYAREGGDLDVSTLADWVGAAAAIRTHVLAADRLHGDDTPVPVLAKSLPRTRSGGKAATGRLWVYVRDDRPFGGSDPPAALYHYARTRAGEHPQRHLAGWAGIFQADAYSGYAGLYDPARKPGPLLEAGCWSHVRRRFFDLAKDGKSPLAAEAVKRIDALFAIERTINGRAIAERAETRQEKSRPLIDDLEQWLRHACARLSPKSDPAKAMDYALKRWGVMTRFLEDGRICLSNNAAERALRGIAVGRRNRTFCGSDAGGDRAAAIYTLIETAKLNDVDPQAWLADTLARIHDHPAKAIADLLPWNWKAKA